MAVPVVGAPAQHSSEGFKVNYKGSVEARTKRAGGF